MGISYPTIRDRLKENNKQPVKAKDTFGRPGKFYSEEDVKEVCRYLMDVKLSSDSEGFIVIKNKKYGTIPAWGRILNIGPYNITGRLKKYPKPFIKGRDASGQITNFYLESDIMEICADLMNIRYQADESGFLKIGRRRCATIPVWANEYSVGQQMLRDKLKNADSIRAKDMRGRIWDFYSEKDVIAAIGGK